MKSILAVVILAVVAACAAPDFANSFAALEKGATRADVEGRLGTPDSVEDLEIPEGPFWGPSESLVSVLGPGSPFEQWLYQRDGNDYYVWFASAEGREKAEWHLVDKAVYPTGAVFEAQQ